MKLLSSTLHLICCVAMAYAATELTETAEFQKFFDHMTSTRYNKNIPPRGNGGYGSPIEVYVTAYIIDVYKLDRYAKDYQVSFYFRQSWNDSRLAHAHLDIGDKLTLNDRSMFWTPDLFFVHEKTATLHNVVTPNIFVRIRPNGEVMMSNRYTMTSSCKMDFKDFPHDIQRCNLTTESYGYTTNRVTLFWDYRKFTPVSFNQETDIYPYQLESAEPYERFVNVSSGQYKTLAVELTFSHSVQFFMKKLYVPSLFFVCLAWLSFWISSKLVALRLSLLMVTLFLMFRTGFYVECYVPSVPYPTGVDVWVGVCEALIFVAFLEFIAVSVVAKSFSSNSGHLASDPESLIQPPNEKDTSNGGARLGSLIASRLRGDLPVDERIDRVFRVILPILFVLFGFIYFLIY